MGYTIGVSSGWWKIAKPPDLLGLAQKVGGFGSTVGVRFIQADVETTSEFFEPRLKEEIKRVKKEMGMRVGLHAEVGELMSLESAERRLWEQSHLRLVETVKNAADFGLEYIVVHMSSRPQLIFLEAQYRVTGYFHPVVSYDGRPLYHICEDKEVVKDFVKRHMRSVGRIAFDENIEAFDKYRERQRELERKYVTEEKEKLKQDLRYQYFLSKGILSEQRRMEDDAERIGVHKAHQQFETEESGLFYDGWKSSPNAKYLTDAAEITAYMMVAEYMKQKNDPLWSSICGNGNVEVAYGQNHAGFNAACGAKYLEGHLTVRDNPDNIKHLKGMSILEWLKKHDVILCIETPEAHEGYEGLLRLFNPLDAVVLIRKLGTEHVKLCIDFEHIISHKMRPEDIIPKLPADYIRIIHLSKPIPYGGTAHIPLAIGSKGQEILYNWLFQLRKRGFKDGYLIYERGGGRSGGGKSAWEVMENSVWTMRQIAMYLEKDIPPGELPPEFYGISEQNKETFARQMASMRDHAWDPLEGLLMIPEEKHTFLSRAAVEKQKAELWEKRKFR